MAGLVTFARLLQDRNERTGGTRLVFMLAAVVTAIVAHCRIHLRTRQSTASLERHSVQRGAPSQPFLPRPEDKRRPCKYVGPSARFSNPCGYSIADLDHIAADGRTGQLPKSTLPR